MDSGREGRRPSGRRRWLRVAAAAQMLEVSEHTLRRWADAGVVPCRRTPSGQRRFLPGDLERFLEGGGGNGGRGNGGGGNNGACDVARNALVVSLAGDVLPRVTRAVAREQDPRAALGLIAHALVDCLTLEGSAVMARDERLDALVCAAAAGGRSSGANGRGDRQVQDGETWPLDDRPAAREMLRSGEPLRDRSRLCVPFGLGDRANGCLVLQGRGAGRLPAAGLALARDLGDLAALGVHRLQADGERDRQAGRMDSLLHAGQSMTSSLVLQDVLDAVAREVVDTFGARYCVIWEYAEDEEMLIQRAGYGAGDAFSPGDDLVLLAERPKEREILFSAEPVLETVSDPQLDRQSRESMERWGEKTCLSLPLRFGGETLGVLVICETDHERRFCEEEMALARGLANQASAVVHNARVYRDLEERNVELVGRARRERLLNELSLELGSSLERRTVLDSACRAIGALLDVSTCGIYAQRDDGAVECLAVWADGKAVDDFVGRRFPLEQWTTTRVALDSGETVVVNSLEDPRLGADERAVMRRWDQLTLLAAPMRARGRVLGTVEMTRPDADHPFSAEDVATAEACARMTALSVDNALLFERQADHARRVTSLLEAGRAITSSLDINDVLAALVRTAATSLDCPEAIIFAYDAEDDTMTMRSVFQEDPVVYDDMDKPYPLSDYPSDRVLLESDDVVVETISDPDLARDVRESMERHGEQTCLTVPLRYGATPLGMLTLIETAEERTFSEADLGFARGFAEQAAMAMHNAQLFEDVKGLHLGNLRALSSALTAKDIYTIGHTARVAAYAVLLAAELGWTPRRIQLLEEATYLHDIGKIAVADRVLLKSGALTDEEWALMKQHPTISAEIIEALLDDEYVAGVRHHHERYDGTGYPDGLAGRDIPLVARLLCLVDSYDAMSSRRVYRPALTYDECVTELRSCSGTQFDPELVDAFVRVLGDLAAQREELQVAAEEAAGRISAADHAVLRRPEDAVRAEYARILRGLRRTRRAHPEVEELFTTVPTDQMRSIIVVDSDVDDATAVPTGEVLFSDDLVLETFAGRTYDANVVLVDRWGTWIAAAAPIRDEDGAVVGAVTACRQPGHGLPAGVLKSAVSDTFAEIMRTAAARQTRAEIESMTDALTGLYNHRRFHELLTRDPLRRAGGRVRGRPALLRHRPLQAAERPVRAPRGRRRAAPGEPDPDVVDPARRRGGAVRGRRVLRPAAGRRHRRGAGGGGAGPPPRRRALRDVRRGCREHQHRCRHGLGPPRRQRAPRQRRRRDVRGQGGRPRPRGPRRHPAGGPAASRDAALASARRRERAGGHLLRDAAQPAAAERRELRRQGDRLAAHQLADLAVQLVLAVLAGERQEDGALHEDHVDVGRRHADAGAGPADSGQPGAHAADVRQQRRLHDLEAATGGVRRRLEHFKVLLQARVVRVVRRARLRQHHAGRDELRHVVHVPRGGERAGVLDQAVGQPDDLLDPEPLLEQGLVVAPAQAEITVVQQALLGGEQRPLAVGVEGAALEHERRLVAPHAPGVGDDRRHLRVPVVGREVLAPAVEAEVHQRDLPLVVAHEDGPVVADPRVVERDGEEVDGPIRGLPAGCRLVQAEQAAGLGLLRRVHDHRDRLEPGDAERHLGPLLARVVHERAEEVFAARPRQQGAPVRREARRQAEPVGARGGRLGGAGAGVVCVMGTSGRDAGRSLPLRTPAARGSS